MPDPEGVARGGGALYSRMLVRTMQHLILYPACDWLIDPYVATPPRNKNRSNRKEVLLKMEKTRLLSTSEKHRLTSEKTTKWTKKVFESAANKGESGYIILIYLWLKFLTDLTAP